MQDGGKAKGVYCRDMFLNHYEAQVELQVQFEHFIACSYRERCPEHCSSEASDKTPILIQKYTVQYKEKKSLTEDKKSEGKGMEKATFNSHWAYSLYYSGTAPVC